MSQRLSSRANRLLESPAVPEYITTNFEYADDAWDATTNPDGYITFCVAENKLMFDVLGPQIQASRSLSPDSLGYDSMVGSQDFREVLASFLSRTFVGRPIDPAHLAVLNGVGSVLELLFYVICDPGDGVLVPTPSYTGFWADLETRDEVNIIPVHTSSAGGFRLTIDQLDDAVDSAEVPVKALLFTNPNNPLGQIHSDEEVLEINAWAKRRGIHLVLDEIYALSTYGDELFHSGASIVDEMHDLLHIVWGFSKDFAMSGFRSAVLFSENEQLMEAVDGLAYWASTSRDTQSMLRQLLSNDAWVDEYLAENRRRLKDSYSAVTAVLDSYDVPHLRADSGLFFVVDARPMMRESTWEAEDEVWRTLVTEHKLNITPGVECHNGEPGFMRLVFSCVSPDAAVEGAHRLGRFASDRMLRHRKLTKADEDTMWDVLFEAAHVADDPGGRDEMRSNRDLNRHIEAWGTRDGDVGICAERNGRFVGAAWLRNLVGWEREIVEFIDDDTPELVISVLPGFEGQGIGTAMMGELLEREAGRFSQIMLTVRANSAAVRLYERVGFVTHKRVTNRVGTESLVMLRPSGPAEPQPTPE